MNEVNAAQKIKAVILSIGNNQGMMKKSISSKKTLSEFFNCTLEIYGRFRVVSYKLWMTNG